MAAPLLRPDSDIHMDTAKCITMGLRDIHMDTAKPGGDLWSDDIAMDTARNAPTVRGGGFQLWERELLQSAEVKRKATVAQLCEHSTLGSCGLIILSFWQFSSTITLCASAISHPERNGGHASTQILTEGS